MYSILDTLTTPQLGLLLLICVVLILFAIRPTFDYFFDIPTIKIFIVSKFLHVPG